MNPLGFIQIGAYSLNGIMIYVYISVPVIVYSFLFLVRFPDMYTRISSRLSLLFIHEVLAWLDVQINSSLHFFSDGEFAYSTMTVYISFICMNHEQEKI